MRCSINKILISSWQWIYSAVILLKFCLWLYCRRFKRSPIAQALAQDHINDVGSNAVALAAYLVASEFPNLSLLDPIGAIVISLWIIWSWYDTGEYPLCFYIHCRYVQIYKSVHIYKVHVHYCID